MHLRNCKLEAYQEPIAPIWSTTQFDWRCRPGRSIRYLVHRHENQYNWNRASQKVFLATLFLETMNESQTLSNIIAGIFTPELQVNAK